MISTWNVQYKWLISIIVIKLVIDYPIMKWRRVGWQGFALNGQCSAMSFIFSWKWCCIDWNVNLRRAAVIPTEILHRHIFVCLILVDSLFQCTFWYLNVYNTLAVFEQFPSSFRAVSEHFQGTFRALSEHFPSSFRAEVLEQF